MRSVTLQQQQVSQAAAAIQSVNGSLNRLELSGGGQGSGSKVGDGLIVRDFGSILTGK